MPSSTLSSSDTLPHVIGASASGAHLPSSLGHFGVVPFRRDASGAIVPGTVVEAPNGDIAWRRARAAAFDHDNVGAIELRNGVLLAQFGEVNLDALSG